MSIEVTRKKFLDLLQQKETRIKNLRLKREHSAQERIFIHEESQLIDTARILIEQYEKREQLVQQPNAVDLEEAVLGAIMLEISALPAVKKFLRADNFFLEAHRLIYEAILSLDKKQEPIDMRTVVIELRTNGKIVATGGAYYIAELTAKVSSAANIEYHARKIVEFSTKRHLIQLAMNILHDAYDDEVDVFELLDAVENKLVETVNDTGEIAAQRWRKSKTENQIL